MTVSIRIAEDRSQFPTRLSPAENRILSELRECSHPVTKQMLRDRTLLSLTAVNLAVDRLVKQHGFLHEEFKKEQTGSGQRKRGGATGFYRLIPTAEYYIGIDLGATRIRSCVLGADLKSKARLHSVPNIGDFQDACHKAADLVLEATKTIPVERVAGIGIAYPGSVIGGITRSAVNLGNDFLNRNLVDKVRRVLLERSSPLAHRKIVLAHNSSCTVLAERERGGPNLSRRRDRNLLSIQLGKGIGLGVSLDGVIYEGTDGRAGEFGHLIMAEAVVPCACGKKGCLEAVASASAVARLALPMLDKPEGQSIRDIVAAELRADKKQRLTSKQIEQIPRMLEGRHVVLAAETDEFARQLLRGIGQPLGQAIAFLVNLYAPDRIVLGGRFSPAYPYFESELLRTCKANCWGPSWKDDLIVLTNLPEEATCWGAAINLFEHIYGRILFGAVSRIEGMKGRRTNEQS